MKIIFAGTPDFSVAVLQALIDAKHEICAVYTQPDRPKGRGRKLALSPVKIKAQSYELPIFQPTSLRNKQDQEQLASLNADVMVVVAYGLILPQAILDAPKLGCLNVHASILPKYRGASPIQAAILNGDLESGVTIMQMDKGLDTGAMILKKYCHIGANDNAAQLHDVLSSLGANGIVETLAAIENDSAIFETQDDSQTSYAGKIAKEDACIDWSQSSSKIHDLVRAYNPWPVAYSFLNSNKIRIWQTEIIESSYSEKYADGQIIEVGKDFLIIACADKALSIKKIQLSNSKPMLIKDCLNSKRSMFVVGECFAISPTGTYL